jgi:hypothetical protein
MGTTTPWGLSNPSIGGARREQSMCNIALPARSLSMLYTAMMEHLLLLRKEPLVIIEPAAAIALRSSWWETK